MITGILGWGMIAGTRSLAVTIALGTAALATPADAATVEVRDVGASPRNVTVVFTAAAGEANAIAISLLGEESGKHRLMLVDSGATLTAGAGCSGGGAPGTPAECLLDKGIPPTCGRGFCFGGLIAGLELTLGSENDALDAGSLPASTDFTIKADAGEGADSLATGGGPDLINAGLGADQLSSGAGTDVLAPSPGPADGPDALDAGAGVDRVDYSAAPAVEVTFDGQSNDGPAGDGDNVLATESATGGSADDRLDASAAPTAAAGFLTGGVGNDTLIAGPPGTYLGGDAGDDRLLAGPGGATLIGGLGADDLIGGEGADSLNDGPLGAVVEVDESDDTMRGAAGSDRLLVARGDDFADGGPGQDTLEFDYYLDGGVRVDLRRTDPQETGAAGTDTLVGLEHVIGTPATDRLTGTRGPNRIEAFLGGDVMRGLAGDDVLLGANGRERLIGGGGADRLRGSFGPDVLLGQGGVDLLFARVPEGRDRDRIISCGRGNDARERALVDPADPAPRSC